MQPSTPLGAGLLLSLAVALTSGEANAQPVHVSYWTIEAKVAQAESVLLGTISHVTPNTPKRPDGPIGYTLTIRANEALKGDVNREVGNLLTNAIGSPDPRYEQWMQAKTSILFFLGPTPKAGAGRTWDCLPLGAQVPAERGFSARQGPPMFSLDFTVLPDTESILTRARAFAKAHPRRLPVHAIRIPPAVGRKRGFGGPLDDLLVPVEPSLEARAKRLLATPEEFVLKEEALDAYSRHQLRFGGVDSLRYFKSDANAALLRSLLADPPEKFENPLSHSPPIRVRAFEILLDWRMPSPLPGWPERVTRLELAGTRIGEAELKRVAALEHLTELDIQYTGVTPVGLRLLAPLKKLRRLHLGEAQLSDATLRALREIGQLHVLAQADLNGDTRPMSPSDVVELALCRTPVTDAGLREIADLANLTWLDLRETRITDAGLNQLSRFKKLTRLLLRNTRVTEAGVANLHRALPNCKIDIGPER